MKLGNYIHIPFCIKKCDYCDFISYPDCYDMQEKYIDKVLEEIEENKELLKSNRVDTIYIGGGTPSSIKPELIEKILNKIYGIIGAEYLNKNIKQENDAKSNNASYEENYSNKEERKIEITIEVNPGTTTKQNLEFYKKIGINRLSIGLQSTNDEILKEIGRIHNYKQFLDTYNWAKKAGFENINVDLMLGLPNQDISILKDSLEKVINLKPQHISIYSLIIEEGTKIEKKIQDGILKLPDEEDERNEYHYAKNFLELNGYKHYEISNFALPGYESKHNTNCWKQEQYIGFGVAASSYVKGIRYKNTDDLQKYMSSRIRTIEEIQNKYSMEQEFMMLGFRMLDGVSISNFKNKFGENPLYLFRNEIKKLVDESLIEVDLDNIKLTLKGLDLANLVFEEFI